MLKQLLTRTHGQDLAEYALLLGLIAVVVMIAVAAFGLSLEGMFNGLAATWADVVAAKEPDPEPEPEPEPVPDCYGSLLLPIMVAVAGLAATASRWLPRKPAMVQMSLLAVLSQQRERLAGAGEAKPEQNET